ncbi:MAG: hypothetical protein SPG03_03330 [Veillonella caviae]|uniref:hypothetical protein n=1 Tax=Veillonella caviae TaxID=248316 RepID=UPI0023F175AF|nr:hypothetical protein [Veillonella caviae]MCI6407766.1 hypothetical protein [Veillonella caviae]MDY5481405.1 hypothetical protein [Veillonella caviae]MDY6224653.1 hypothetical protein [Veillonella caviae]
MNEYQLIKQIGKCPKCGCTEFIINSEASGNVSYFVSLVGEECDNSEMYSGLDYRYDEWCVCANCENKLFKYKDYYASSDFLLE